MREDGVVPARMAIEALRAGVPNRPAIRELSRPVLEQPGPSGIVSAFQDRLELCAAGVTDGRAAQGMLVAGSFGSGKSHLLGIFREVALRERFVVSIVPISKETQLFQPGRLFTAAVQAAEVPDLSKEGRSSEPVNDDALTALLRGLKSDQNGYDELFRWVQSPRSSMSEVFEALLYLLPHPNFGPEKISEIAAFFGGGRLTSRRVREWLREVGASRRFDVTMPRGGELDLQRARFFPRLCRAAGYRGWCLFLDELELLGRYSVKQRARSYGEMASWLGLDDEGIPGCLAVGAITDDFVDAVLIGRDDLRRIEPILGAETADAKRARAAMDFIVRQAKEHRLAPPREDELRQYLNRVVELYEAAYGRRSSVDLGERRVGKTLREYIKGWITQLDIGRLYGQPTDLEYSPPDLPPTEDEVFSLGREQQDQ